MSDRQIALLVLRVSLAGGAVCALAMWVATSSMTVDDLARLLKR